MERPPVTTASGPGDDMRAGMAIAPTAGRPDPAALATFQADLSHLGPTRGVFDQHLKALGGRAILEVLESRNASCHGEAHELGRALMALRGDIGAALLECGTGCTSACMHGVVGEAFGGSDITAITARMNSFCETSAMRELHPAGNCGHGIGHALMFAAERNVDAALGGCQGFTRPGMRYYCATGVFMELLASPSPPQLAAQSHEPCLNHPEFAAACYRYRAPSLVSELGGPEALQESCLAQETPFREACFHGLGGVMMASFRQDPSLLGRYCGVGGEAEQTMCVEGAIEKEADFDPDGARLICAKQTGRLRRACDEAVAHGMYDVEKPSLRFYVAAAPR